MAWLFRDKTEMVEEKNALPGRDDTMAVPQRHAVLDTPIIPPFPEGYERIVVGMGCFWGADSSF